MPYTTIRITDENQAGVDDWLCKLKKEDRGWSASAIINEALCYFLQYADKTFFDLAAYNATLEEERNAVGTERTK
jgi:hypothetical protein